MQGEGTLATIEITDRGSAQEKTRPLLESVVTSIDGPLISWGASTEANCHSIDTHSKWVEATVH